MVVAVHPPNPRTVWGASDQARAIACCGMSTREHASRGHRAGVGVPAIAAVPEEGASGDGADEESAGSAVVDEELARGVKDVHVAPC